jgi:antitoxin component YwqK of YwqJK toxin-antitoxin module
MNQIIAALLLCLLASLFTEASMAQGKQKFTKQDSVKLNYCICDSLFPAWKNKPNSQSDQPEFNGNGWYRTLNFKGKIAQCGYFSKFYFTYGLHFFYDENGNITKIRKYFNGKVIGEVKKT